MFDALLSDIDGTLIDNTALHVLAWQRAFRRIGNYVDANAILHKIGMGGDQLAPSILGPDAGDAIKQVQQYHGEEYSAKGLIDHAEPLPGASDLLRALRERGVRIALASSANQEEANRYLEMLGGPNLVDEIVTAKDVTATKPAPDIFAVAMDKLGKPSHALAIGDTVYDIESAGTLGIPCIAVISGGIERETLLDAGAAAVYLDTADLLRHLDDVLSLPAKR
jgi:HAD superfamily hydrolase (TIGR01549 family)